MTIQREKEKKEEMTWYQMPSLTKGCIAERLKIYPENDTLKWDKLVGSWGVYSTV